MLKRPKAAVVLKQITTTFNSQKYCDYDNAQTHSQDVKGKEMYVNVKELCNLWIIYAS